MMQNSNDDRRTTNWVELSAPLLALFAMLGGCTFDSGLDGATCDSEGVRSRGRVCHNGYWVRVGPPGHDASSDTHAGRSEDAGFPSVDSSDTTDTAASADASDADTTPSRDSDTGSNRDTSPKPDVCPGHAEMCNGTDDDCDGTVDEGCNCQVGGASGGLCARGTITEDGSCRPPAGWVADEGPGECDAEDNDCDGDIDEGCACTPDKQRPCYAGAPGTEGVGECKAGHQHCSEDGTWGPCLDQVTPNTEACDGEDNDCDSHVDEGCGCNYDGRTQGVCGRASRNPRGRCTQPTDWMAGTSDESPHCDGRDNDCDGVTDEGCPCDYKGKTDGVCRNLTRDAKGHCPTPADYIDAPMAEDGKWCDGIDNDCDGRTDEDGCMCINQQQSSCYTGPAGTAGTGVCQKGTRSCTDGTWSQCHGETTPAPRETCDDGVDKNCNGAKNDGCPCDYANLQHGICKNQTINRHDICSRPKTFQFDETYCGDGRDNDCDGKTDNADINCKQTAGSSCQTDADCLGRCDGGKCGHVIFVTSQRWTGDLGGLIGADAKCKSRANIAGLQGNWRAILSASPGGHDNHAKDRLTIVGGVNIYNIKGQKVADNRGELWSGSLDNPISYTAKARLHRGDVWTGTKDNGKADAEECHDWTSTNGSGQEGLSDSTDHWLQKSGGDRCNNRYALYCIDGQ